MVVKVATSGEPGHRRHRRAPNRTPAGPPGAKQEERRMEILDEFDNEYPLLFSFCERISPQDFESQALSYTQKALQDLYAQMEQDPGICERVARKRKQAENEGTSLAHYLKAKFFSMLQGDVNYSNALGELEMAEQVGRLKCEMEKANRYALAAKGASWRQSEARPRKTLPLGGFSPSQTQLRRPEPPEMPRVFGPVPKQQTELTAGSTSDLRQLWAGMSSVHQKSTVDLRPFMLNPGGFRPTFLGNTSINRIKYSGLPRFPAGDPMSSSQNAGLSSSVSPFSTPVLDKFKRNQEDEKDNEAPGPDLNPMGA
ncbi:hypothetical protein JRQ81_007647 [Phrynocephalus forsythii]|uniref:Uncharacterized protein n=1 Tax=Phrynocephalus forsythii TaxID=171643 RepID=A0A9Q0XC59_9SAUR|nr:hypothetical protein JRQ81_007647 [Phrynocephalus forsythii]